MGRDAFDEDAPGQAPGDAADDAGLLAEARFLWEEWLGLGRDRFRLAALETRRAGESLAAMVMAGAAAGVLLGSAWLGLAAAAVMALVEQGVAASVALLLAAAVNALAASALGWAIRREARHLQFAATLRSLQPAPRDAGQP